jgi:FKBP-type peptidyl-prolyl cis-trans isomerase FkpA
MLGNNIIKIHTLNIYKMKKWFFASIAFVAILSSCGKKNSTDCSTAAPTTVASAGETAYLQAFLTANGIAATNINGMFYAFSNAGVGASPNLCSDIGLTYRGSFINGLTDGAGFDSTRGSISTLNLAQVIKGWQLVLPLVKTNGSVTLFIPPSLGYGSQAYGPIPGNSYLKFTLSLITVQ